MSAFEGQTAVITGGGSGVGAAVALALAEARASVHLIGRRLDKLESVAAKARSLGSKATCYSGDLATSSGQRELTRGLCTIFAASTSSYRALRFISLVRSSRPVLRILTTQYQTNVRAPVRVDTGTCCRC